MTRSSAYKVFKIRSIVCQINILNREEEEDAQSGLRNLRHECISKIRLSSQSLMRWVKIFNSKQLKMTKKPNGEKRPKRIDRIFDACMGAHGLHSYSCGMCTNDETLKRRLFLSVHIACSCVLCLSYSHMHYRVQIPPSLSELRKTEIKSFSMRTPNNSYH